MPSFGVTVFSAIRPRMSGNFGMPVLAPWIATATAFRPRRQTAGQDSSRKSFASSWIARRFTKNGANYSTQTVSGVQVYDARLVAAMRVHSVKRILTFNAKGFPRHVDIEAVHPRRVSPRSAKGF